MPQIQPSPIVRPPSQKIGIERESLMRDEHHEIVTAWIASGAATPIHDHGESEAWIHVLRGEIVEERWTRDDRGAWSRSRTVMREGESTRVPRGALHRIQARSEASLVTSYSPPPSGHGRAIDPELLAELERS